MIINTSHRSTATEIMDDFQMEGEILRDALDKIARINQLLGGNSITLQGLRSLLSGQPKSAAVHIMDIGCGNGDMLRALAAYAAEKDLNFVLKGIDANKFTVEHARNLSAGYVNISYECMNIFDPPAKPITYDIVLCTLTLHHFKEEEIISLLENYYRKARLGILINDLQRSAVPYYLFKILCFVFRLNEMSREDGLVSILRGFKRADLIRYSKKMNLKNYSIKWKWAFRYQWIIKTT